MPRRRRPDIGCRSQSNMRRATSRANRTYDQRDTDQENRRIAMSELRSLVSDNEVEKLKIQISNQTQQQRAQHNELAQIVFKMFVIARRRFLQKKILGKSTGKIENLNVKKYNSGSICPETN